MEAPTLGTFAMTCSMDRANFMLQMAQESGRTVKRAFGTGSESCVVELSQIMNFLHFLALD